MALHSTDLAAADASLGWRFDLVREIHSRPELAAAWRRGRFLMHVRRLAASGARRHEAARELGMGMEAFEDLLREDIEAAELWNEARLETAVHTLAALPEEAAGGNTRALAELIPALRHDIARSQPDIHRMPEPQICEAFGVTRQTLNRWVRDCACPRNTAEPTYDLPAMVRWFSEYVRASATAKVEEHG